MSDLKARTAERDREAKRSDTLGNVRLALAGVALLLILLPLYSKDGTPWLGLGPVVLLFVVLGKLQDTSFRKRQALDGAIAFHRAALERAEERWRDLADDGRAFGEALPPAHYASDLDLFGAGSLFQLLNRAVTNPGRETLSAWLQTPASFEVVRARQAAVTELARKEAFAEAVAMAGAGDQGRPVEHARLVQWGESRERFAAEGLLRALGVVLPIVLLCTTVHWLVTGQRVLVLGAVLVQVIAVFSVRRLTEPRALMLSGPERVLGRFAALLEAIEAADLEASVLAELKSRCQGAVGRIRSLLGLVNLLDARLNMFFALSVGPALMWDLNLTLRAERWRREIGPSIRGWFEAIGEMEALLSLAALARERPDYSMPVLHDGCVFEAKALAHPLIRRDAVVANDLTLGGAGSVLLLSGSNMSGKSTLLRSVGINAVLARAGGPVAARRLALSDLELGTSVRVIDSLAHGTSHFYAELARLKHILDLAEASNESVLYLLDEVLHGTNSKERYIGAVSVIRWLAKAGAMGIVTTHDLALADVEQELDAGQVTNRHFSDDIVDGEMRFDYRLRDGPVQSTNALRLMKHIGIDVEYVEPTTE